MTAVSHLRLRRVRFKDGRTLEIFKSRKASDQEYFASQMPQIVKNIIEAHTKGGVDISGFAFMMWSSDGTSTCDARTDGNVPSILVPDFVRSRLLAQRIEAWTLDTLYGV